MAAHLAQEIDPLLSAMTKGPPDSRLRAAVLLHDLLRTKAAARTAHRVEALRRALDALLSPDSTPTLNQIFVRPDAQRKAMKATWESFFSARKMESRKVYGYGKLNITAAATQIGSSLIEIFKRKPGEWITAILTIDDNVQGPLELFLTPMRER